MRTDRAIAEMLAEAMGWEMDSYSEIEEDGKVETWYTYGNKKGAYPYTESPYPFSPATRWDHIGIVIDWMESENGLELRMNTGSHNGRRYAWFGRFPGVGIDEHGSLPLHIALAALKALEANNE